MFDNFQEKNSYHDNEFKEALKKQIESIVNKIEKNDLEQLKD